MSNRFALEAALQELFVRKTLVHRQKSLTHVRWQVVPVFWCGLPLRLGSVLPAPRVRAWWAEAVVGHRVVSRDVVVGGHLRFVHGPDVTTVRF